MTTPATTATDAPDYSIQPVPFTQVRLTDPFWAGPIAMKKRWPSRSIRGSTRRAGILTR